jgi:tRNA/rRNA methyltransferase
MVHVILANPLDGANVGAVCRVLKNMGIAKLHIIGGAELDETRVKTLAVHAWDVWENRSMHSSLSGALADFSLTAGTTRRRGRWRKYSAVSPKEFAEKITKIGTADIAVVFGNETHGLTDDELKQCHMAITIPSSESCPSLNLSHAVQVVAYEIFAGQRGGSLPNPISGLELDSLVAQVADSLEEIGFFTQTGKEEMSRFFRDIFARAGLACRESERIKRIFKKIRDLKIHRKES